LPIPDQCFVSRLAGFKARADIVVTVDTAFGLYNFFYRLGTTVATMQDGISAAKTLVRGNEFLIEGD